jgi:hypothetical protein
MPGAAPANIDVYLNPGIKTTLISGRNLPDISTVVGRAVTPSTREGVGRPWLAPPEVPTSWHDTLQVLDLPSRPVTFYAQPNTRPCARRNQTETFQLIRSMSMRKLSPSFNEAASVLAGPGITE